MAELVKGQNEEKRTEKQIGCMSGFLQIFDRQQILAGKRIHSTKRLPPPTGVGASPETMISGVLHEFSREPEKPEPHRHVVAVAASADNSQSSPVEKLNDRPKSPVLAPTFEQKGGTLKSSWKSSKEIPRFSFDSKATVGNKPVADGDKDQRRSPSVIARLMGLEPLLSSDQKTMQNVTKPDLERSHSESRVSRDLVHSKYIDDSNFQVKQPNKSQKQSAERIVREGRSNVRNRDFVKTTAMEYAAGNMKSEYSSTAPWKSRSVFDSADFYPGPNQTTVTMHGDFGKKLKLRGMGEQSSDLRTLKQILEVLQIKGLLHSTNPSDRDSQQNFVNDRDFHPDESTIVLVKPWRLPASKVDHQRSVNDSRGSRRHVSENSPHVSLKRDGEAVDRSGRIPVRARTTSPNRIQSNLKSCNSVIKRKQLNFEIQRRENESSGAPKRSSIDSPKLTPKRNSSVHHSMINRYQRNQKPTESFPPNQKPYKNIVREDESSSISESIVTTPSTTDSERSKWERCREGKSLLHRCDKLIHSKPEMNSTGESPPSSATVLPSPVSVLDSGFDTDESSTPSHSIDFKVYEQAASTFDLKDENGSPKLSSTKSTECEDFISNVDSDFIYISEIIRASQHLQEDSNAFFWIEKHLYNTSSDLSKRQRKLVFDVVHEILNRNRQLPPWKVLTEDPRSSIKQIWCEFQKIRETNTGDGLLELVSAVIKKDLVEISDWRDYPIETSETILDIERMIFKDLVSEAIRELAEFSGECMFLRSRRKLVF